MIQIIFFELRLALQFAQKKFHDYVTERGGFGQMGNSKIDVVARLEFGDTAAQKSEKVTKLYEGKGRKIVRVELADGEVLNKHKAAEPITVLCLAGHGLFRAGGELEDLHELAPGSLITLEEEIPHDVTAHGGLKLLVTKFRKY